MTLTAGHRGMSVNRRVAAFLLLATVVITLAISGRPMDDGASRVTNDPTLRLCISSQAMDEMNACYPEMNWISKDQIDLEALRAAAESVGSEVLVSPEPLRQ